MTELSQYHQDWLASKGIDYHVASEDWELRSEEDTLVFPYPGGATKHRYVKEGEARRFRMDGALSLYYSALRWDDSLGVAFICEGESDTLALATNMDASHCVTGIGGLNGWKPAFASHYKNCDRVFVILDNDEDYNKQAIADKTWESIRKDLGNKAVRVHLPEDVKDVCEFFSKYPDTVFNTLLDDAENYKGQYHYNPVDLAAPPPKYDWLVDGWLAKGDVCLLLGQSGVGKSWVSMSLTTAIANGDDSWMGRSLDPHNQRVYYIDEENPLDVVYARLTGLGLLKENAGNIRYLSDAGIRLDKNPGKVMDECIAFEPSLIVIDSLTRVHTASENDSGEMAKLLNDGIRPLARQTGASVLLLHHENKGESSNAYARSRGSTDIPASIDTGIRVSNLIQGGDFCLQQFKTRRSGNQKEIIKCQFADTPDGTTISLVETGKMFL